MVTSDKERKSEREGAAEGESICVPEGQRRSEKGGGGEKESECVYASAV